MSNIPIDLPKDAFSHMNAGSTESEIITRPSITFWADARRRLFKNKVAMIGLSIIIIITMLAIFVPIFSQYSYTKQDLTNTNAPPSIEHPFGTDSHGRDLWVRVWVGARVSLAVGIFGSVIPGIIGVVIGGISGYFGGKVDMIIMRFIDIVMCVPNMIYIILITIYIGTGPVALVIAFALTGWMGTARSVRGMILQLKEQEFVLASRTLGASSATLIFQHLIPNTLGIVVVSMTMGVPAAIFKRLFKFIGLGIAPPIPS